MDRGPVMGKYEVKGEHVVITPDTVIGDGTVIWNFVNLWGCRIGRDCVISSFVEIGRGVEVGDRCKIEAFVYIPPGVRAFHVWWHRHLQVEEDKVKMR